MCELCLFFINITICLIVIESCQDFLLIAKLMFKDFGKPWETNGKL